MHVCQAPEKHWCFHVYKEIPGAILYRSPLLLALESDPDIHIELLGSRRPGSFHRDRGPGAAQPRASSEDTPLGRGRAFGREPLHLLGWGGGQ